MISPQFDPLTGALSRAALFPIPEAALHAAQLTSEETALLVLDYAQRLEEAEPLPSPTPALPTPKHSLIGRDRELLELKQLLRERRLVTLVATGGMGKTHLAMQAALEVAHLYRDGVYFVALAGLDRAEELPGRLVQAFGLKATGDPQESLVQHFAGRQVLWVLDNFEQLLEAGEFLRALLQALPGLTLLVTSRERLGLSEEWALPLEGLALDEEGGDSAALRLLLQAIRRVNPGLRLSKAELEAWPLLVESLFLFRQMGQVASLALTLASCAQALLALQQPAQALQIAVSVQRWDQQAPTKLPPQTRRNLEAYIQQAREALSTDEQIPASSLEQAYQLAMDVQLA